MSKKILKRTWEEPVDDAEDENVEEEFRFDPVTARQNILPKGVRKTRLTLDLDDDVVAWLMQKAALPDAPSCQSQINKILRAAMTGIISGELRSALLNDQEFVTALAEKVAERTARRKQKNTRPQRRAA